MTGIGSSVQSIQASGAGIDKLQYTYFRTIYQFQFEWYISPFDPIDPLRFPFFSIKSGCFE